MAENREGIRRLISLQDSQALSSPLGHSSKIKYTCITASPHFVALGANTGGVYCFHRDGLRFIRIVANKEGAISLVRFAPSNENCLAVVIGGGQVVFWELNLQEQAVSKRFHVSSLLKDSTIRNMVWDSRGLRLLYGDAQGRIAVAYMPKISKKFASGSLFKKPDEIIYMDRDKSPIVQMDFYQEMLLVSTQTRCVLVKLSSKEVHQIGKKPRDGQFGACFHARITGRPPVVYSARPGGRLWEADIVGTVVSTLKLKDMISVPPSHILGVGFSPPSTSTDSTQLTQALNLSTLCILTHSYMVSSLENQLFVFDPASCKLATWTDDLQGITDVFSDGRQLFVLCEGGRRAVELSALPVGSCLKELVRFGELQQAQELLKPHSEEIAELLAKDENLYHPLRTALEFSKSLKESAELPPSLLSLQVAVAAVEERRKREKVGREGDGDGECSIAAGSRSQEVVDSSSVASDRNKSPEKHDSNSTLADGHDRPGEPVTAAKVEEQALVNGDTSLVEVDLGLYPEVFPSSSHDSVSIPGSGGSSMPNGELRDHTEGTIEFHHHPYPIPPISASEQVDSSSDQIPARLSPDQSDSPLETSDQGLPMDIANTEMAFDHTDFDQPVESSRLTHEADTDTHAYGLDVSDSQESSTKEEQRGRERTAKPEPAEVRIQHHRSRSWSGSLDDALLPDGQVLGAAPIAPQGLSGEHTSSKRRLSSSEIALNHHTVENRDMRADELAPPVSLVAYPESAGIEIPKREALLNRRGSGFSDFPDPYNQRSAASSLESGSTMGSQSELNQLTSSRKPVGGDNTARGFSRSTSLTGRSDLSDRISMALRRQGWREEEEDVVAVPVKSSSGGSSKDGGGVGRRRKKSSKRKKSSPSSSVSSRRSDSSSSLRLPSRAQLIPHVTEEEILPFPDAGLPPTPPSLHPLTASHPNSTGTSRSISPCPTPPKADSLLASLNPGALLAKVKAVATQIEPPVQWEKPASAKSDKLSPSDRFDRFDRFSAVKPEKGERFEKDLRLSPSSKSDRAGERLPQGKEPEGSTRGGSGGLQKPAALISKMKSIAIQGGQNIGIEPETIQRPMKKMKELFSSIAGPQLPSASPPNYRPLSLPPSQPHSFGYQTVYRNEVSFPPQPRSMGSTFVNLPEAVAPPPSYPETLSPPDSQALAFTTATNDTRALLEDPYTICSPTTMRQVLKDWLKELERFHNLVHSSTAATTVTSLTTEELGSHRTETAKDNEEGLATGSGLGTPATTSNAPSVVKRREETSDATPANEQRDVLLSAKGESTSPDVFHARVFLSLNDSTRLAVTELLALCVELEVYSSSPGGSEGGLVELVHKCASVIDGPRLREALVNKAWGVRADCWNTLVDRLQEGDVAGDYVMELLGSDPESAVEYISESISYLPPNLPLYMHKLSHIHRQGYVELCLRCYPHIMPWEVAVACGVSDQSDYSIGSCDTYTSQSDQRAAVYGKYLRQLLQLKTEKTQYPVLEVLRSDVPLLMVSLRFLLQLRTNKQQLSTPQGHPHPWSHLEEWDYPECLETLVGVAVTMDTQQQANARTLCQTFGYWLGVVWLSVAMGDSAKALHTLLLLGDMRLFTHKQKWGLLPGTVREWKTLVKMMTELKVPASSKEEEKEPLLTVAVPELLDTAGPHSVKSIPLRSGESTESPISTFPETSSSQVLDRSSERVNSFGGYDLGLVSSTRAPVADVGDTPREPGGLEEVVTTAELTCPDHSPPERGGGKDRVFESAHSLPSLKARAPPISSSSPTRTGFSGRTGYEVTQLGLVKHMLGCLGPNVVSELMSQLDLSGNEGGGKELERQLHFLLVQLSSVHTQQRALAHLLLEKVDRYLWSPRSASLSPQLLAVQTEEQVQAKGQPDAPTRRLVLQGTLITSVPGYSSSLEDATSHWGIRVQGASVGRSARGVCPVCRLPLVKTVSDAQPGVVAFHCGHAFHKSCASEQACITCFNQNFRSGRSS